MLHLFNRCHRIVLVTETEGLHFQQCDSSLFAVSNPSQRLLRNHHRSQLSTPSATWSVVVCRVCSYTGYSKFDCDPFRYPEVMPAQSAPQHCSPLPDSTGNEHKDAERETPVETCIARWTSRETASWHSWHSPCLGSPSRDFSPNLKQDLSGLSGFFRQLRSKSCFKMSGLSGFWTVYLKKPLKNRARFERFWAVYLKKPLKNRARFNNKKSTTEGFEPAIFWFEVRRLIR